MTGKRNRKHKDMFYPLFSTKWDTENPYYSNMPNRSMENPQYNAFKTDILKTDKGQLSVLCRSPKHLKWRLFFFYWKSRRLKYYRMFVLNKYDKILCTQIFTKNKLQSHLYSISYFIWANVLRNVFCRGNFPFEIVCEQ